MTEGGDRRATAHADDLLATAHAAACEAMVVTARSVTAACGRPGGLAEALEALLAVRGRVVVTGLGKSGLIGAKLAATLASTGTPAFFVHAAEALHGDAGMVTDDDLLLAISSSGGTAEVCRFAELAVDRGVPVVAMTGCGGASALAALAVATVDVGVAREADPHDLAPTASTTVTAAVGDALAVGLMAARGFGPEDFHRHHPGGALGRRLAVGAAPPTADGAGDGPGAAPAADAAPGSTARPVEVCVVGSFMMDLVVRTPRLPTRGETLIGTGFGTYLGGKGFNQAVAAARVGATTAMVGRLGDDEFGRAFEQALADEGIDDRHVTRDPTHGTGVGLPVVEAGGDNAIVVAPRANHAMTPALVAGAEDLLGRADVVLLQLELPHEATVAAARAARAAGALVVLNPAPADDLAAFAGLVDVVVPNESEAARIAGRDPGAAEPRALADAVGRAVGADVVLTLGAAGCVVVADGTVTTLRAHDVAAVDTVGAGDAFCGVLGARLARGDDLVQAARVATAAAALCVTGEGAAPSMPTDAAVQALLATPAERPVAAAVT